MEIYITQLKQLDEMLDKLYAKENPSTKDQVNIRLLEKRYQEIEQQKERYDRVFNKG